MPHTIQIKTKVNQQQTALCFEATEEGQVLGFTQDIIYEKLHYIHGSYLEPLAISFYDENRVPLFEFLPTDGAEMHGEIKSGDNSEIGYNRDAREDGIQRIGQKWSETYYHAAYQGAVYEGYLWVCGANPCLMMYWNGQQIALLVEDFLSSDNQYSMTLYALDLPRKELQFLCLFALVYHDFENIRNQKSRWQHYFRMNSDAFHRTDFVIGNTSNYHVELPLNGLGKEKYDPSFLNRNFPNHTQMVSYCNPDDVMGSIREGFRVTTRKTWTRKNFKKNFLKPAALIPMIVAYLFFLLVFAYAMVTSISVAAAVIACLIFTIFYWGILIGSFALIYSLICR